MTRMDGAETHLTREELAALFSTEKVSGSAVQARDITPFDFRRPEKMAKEHEQSLRVVFGNFARNVAGTLSTFLRSVVDVELVSLTETPYEEFIADMPNPSLAVVCSIPPLEGKMLFILDAHLSLVCVDRLMGGPGDTPPSKVRELTQIEVALMRRVMARALSSLKDAWASVVDVTPAIDEMESSLVFVQPIAAAELVVAVLFSVSVRRTKGLIRLCMPFYSLKPIIPKLHEQLWFQNHEQLGGTGEALPEVRRQVLGLPVTVKVHLGEATISVAELLDLQVGDCVVLNRQEGDELPVLIGGQVQMWGRLGAARRAYAISITRWHGQLAEESKDFEDGGDRP
jgi:flagellar motor switch protein FliM